MISWSIPISKGLKVYPIFLKYDRVLISAFIIVILFWSLGIDIYATSFYGNKNILFIDKLWGKIK